MPELGRPPVMLDIVEEHFEELDFLWELREGIIFAPDWNLEELAEHEERCEAHLDGLRLAELHAVDIARPHLGGKQTFGATAATFVLMESGDPDLRSEVIGALQNAGDEARDGIRIGLRHSDVSPLAEALRGLATSGDAAVRAAAVDILAFHRLEAPPGVLDLLDDPDVAVRRLAFGAASRYRLGLDPRHLESSFASEDPSVRRSALEAFARLGVPHLANLCRSAAQASDDPVPEALAFLGVLGDPADFDTLRNALEAPDLATHAIQGLGALGCVDAIPVLIDRMGEADLASAAAAAFERITGVEPARAEPPAEDEADEAAGTGDDESADEVPPLDPQLTAELWAEASRPFDPSQLWQEGEVARAETPVDSLHLETRRDLLLRRGSADPGSVPDIELEGRARAQR